MIAIDGGGLVLDDLGLEWRTGESRGGTWKDS
jgi:hypothetical protein